MLKRLLVAILLLAAGCAALVTMSHGKTVKGVNLYVSNAGRVECHCVQVAADENTREVGLSPDGDPAPFSAMAFTWPALQTPSFWMKNTAGPLQIAFADSEGVVRQVSSLDTCDGNDCPVVDSSVRTRLAVEAPDLAALGIVAGASLSLGDGCEVRK